MAREQRRLAAILAADVVGYSRLMGRDEAGTLARLRAHRRDCLEPALAQHGGRLVKLIGDGALVEFASAVDALSAAIAFQQSVADANRGMPEDDRLVFRIGLHLGDLIIEGDDVYGDSVNVAARLEGQAPPGGILLSGSVHDAVAGRLACTFQDAGALALKNIERQVRAFRAEWLPEDWPQVPAGDAPSVLPPAASAPRALPDKPSIAVLPFNNMSGDAEQEYFADGITEELITALSRFRSLFVIARNSTFTYKGRAVDVRTAARELGVRYVLEGSVRKAGNRVRITGQLIEAEIGSHIWAERYDGDLIDVFDLQDKVTVSVVGAIAPRLERAETERARRKPTSDLGAYDLYLRALAGFNEGTPEALIEARRQLYQTLERDPGFAIAHVMIAWCTSALQAGGAETSDAHRSASVRLSRRAMELDPDDDYVMATAAWVNAFLTRELDTAVAVLARALALNPNRAITWRISGWLNLWLGKPELAIADFEHADRLSPLEQGIWHASNGMAHAKYMAGLDAEALNWATLSLRSHESGRAAPHLRLAAASAAMLGRFDEARAFCAEFLRMDPARRVSNLDQVLGPYRRQQDVARYKEGLRRAGLPE